MWAENLSTEHGKHQKACLTVLQQTHRNIRTMPGPCQDTASRARGASAAKTCTKHAHWCQRPSQCIYTQLPELQKPFQALASQIHVFGFQRRSQTTQHFYFSTRTGSNSLVERSHKTAITISTCPSAEASDLMITDAAKNGVVQGRTAGESVQNTSFQAEAACTCEAFVQTLSSLNAAGPHLVAEMPLHTGADSEQRLLTSPLCLKHPELQDEHQLR